MKYWISEIFTSIQGEGNVIGIPSNFIRLAGCLLRCIWCDTKYSWFKYEGKLMSVDEIINELDKEVKVTTITGGEPLLQDLVPLASKLKEMEHKIIVETSGTIRPSKKLIELVDVFSVSPKLSNAGFFIPYNLKNETWPTYYKFVILNPKKDLKEVQEFVVKNGIDPEKVIVQPDGRRKDYIQALRELSETILEMKLPFRVLPQLHRIIDFR
ncbi:MAG: 7-carboxy-7-deazaguanine synthase QueE [Sulfolobaceae archaeon]